MQPHAPDQTRIPIAFGRMTNQPGRFVDDEQIVIFVDDLKKFFHVQRHCAQRARKILSQNNRCGKSFSSRWACCLPSLPPTGNSANLNSSATTTRNTLPKIRASITV